MTAYPNETSPVHPLHRHRLAALLTAAVVAGGLALAIPKARTDLRPPIPAPASMRSEEGLIFRRGRVGVGPANRILVTDPSLHQVAGGFSETLWTAADLELLRITAFPDPSARSGDIVLAVDPALGPELYVLSTADVLRVTGGTPTAVAWGLSTLLQISGHGQGRLQVPRVRIEDGPAHPYRGVMVDVARRPYSVDELKELVVLCHVYRVRFLHLHLSDDQAFTFPLASRPKVTSWRGYTRSELKELDDFAAARGVTLVPGIDLPGRSAALIEADPELFALPDRSLNRQTLHIGRQAVYQAVDELVEEVTRLFHRSPYVHIGGGEVNLAGFDRDPESRAFMQERGLESTGELYHHFVAAVAEMVRSRGKRPVVWDGFGRPGRVDVPRQVLVMAGEGSARRPDSLMADGYEVVNVSRKPLSVSWGRRWGEEDLLRWSPNRWEDWQRQAPAFRPILAPPGPNIRGGQMSVWGQDGFLALPALRRRLPLIAEELWLGRDLDGDLPARMARADRLLERLTRPAHVGISGRLDPDYDGPDVNRRDRFADEVTLHGSPIMGGDRVVVRLDGGPPEPTGEILDGPVRIDATGPVRFQVFDGAGRPRGFSWTRYLERWPIEAMVAGGLPSPDQDPSWTPGRFADSVVVELRNLGRGGAIRYTVDGRGVDAHADEYRRPLTLHSTTRLRARVWSEDGQAMGAELDRTFERVETVDHMALLARVRTGPGDPSVHASSFAVDGLLDRERHWAGRAGDGTWLEVDLGELRDVRRLRTYTHWDGSRAYGFRVTGSVDRNEWHLMMERAVHAEVATPYGYEDEVDSRAVRWIRIEFTASSSGPWGHLVELAVFPE